MAAKMKSSGATSGIDFAFVEKTYKELIEQLRDEIKRLKTIHAEELNCVIEENKKLTAVIEKGAAALTDRTDQGTESGSPDSSELQPENENPVQWAAMLVNGLPLQRIRAQYWLQDMARENKTLKPERDRLRQELETITAERDRLRSKQPETSAALPPPVQEKATPTPA
jgi:hypothetical protein